MTIRDLINNKVGVEIYSGFNYYVFKKSFNSLVLYKNKSLEAIRVWGKYNMTIKEGADNILKRQSNLEDRFK